MLRWIWNPFTKKPQQSDLSDEIIYSEDVFKYIEDVQNWGHVYLFVRVAKENKDLRVSNQALEMISELITSNAENRDNIKIIISLLHKKKLTDNIVKRLHVLDNYIGNDDNVNAEHTKPLPYTNVNDVTRTRIFMTSFEVLERLSVNTNLGHKVILKKKVINGIVSTMTTNVDYYQGIYDKGLNILLRFLEDEDTRTRLSELFCSAGGLCLLYLLINKAAENRKDPSMILKVLSLIDLPKQTLTIYNMVIYSIIDKVFTEIKMISENGMDFQDQGFANSRTVSYTLMFAEKIISGLLFYEDCFKEKRYLETIMVLIHIYSGEDQIQLSGSQTIINFLTAATVHNDTHKAISQILFNKVSEILFVETGSRVPKAYFNVLDFLIKEDEDCFTKTIDLGLVDRILEVMEQNPSDKALQINGLKVVSTVIISGTRTQSNAIVLLSSINIGLTLNVLRRLLNYDTTEADASAAIDALNKVQLSPQNIGTMIYILSLETIIFTGKCEIFQERYRDFETADKEVIIRAVKEGGVEFFVDSLKSFKANQAIVRSCLMILKKMFYEEGAALNKLKKYNGVNAILCITEDYHRDCEICPFCMRCLKVLQKTQNAF